MRGVSTGSAADGKPVGVLSSLQRILALLDSLSAFRMNTNPAECSALRSFLSGTRAPRSLLIPVLAPARSLALAMNAGAAAIGVAFSRRTPAGTICIVLERGREAFEQRYRPILSPAGETGSTRLQPRQKMGLARRGSIVTRFGADDQASLATSDRLAAQDMAPYPCLSQTT